MYGRPEITVVITVAQTRMMMTNLPVESGIGDPNATISRISGMVIDCRIIFALPRVPAEKSTPSASYTPRMEVTKSSRRSIATTIHPATPEICKVVSLGMIDARNAGVASMTKPPRIRSLSAIGSMMRPNLDSTFHLRARCPSSASVIAAMTKTMVAAIKSPVPG